MGSTAAMGDLGVPQLVSILHSSFQKSDFDEVKQILASREASLRSDIERGFSEELTLKEVERMELESRCRSLEREAKKAQEESRASALEVEKYKGICAGFEMQVERMKERIANLAAENRVLEMGKKGAVNEAGEWKKKCWELEEENARLRAEEGERAKKREEGKGDMPLGGSGKDHGDESNASGVGNRISPAVVEVEADLGDDRVGQSGAKTVFGDVIEISDGEDEMDVNDLGSKGCNAGQNVAIKKEASPPRSTRSMLNVGIFEDDETDNEKNFLSTPTPKRKRVSRVITSDSEDEKDDDLMPIARLKQRRVGEVTEAFKESIDSPDNSSSIFEESNVGVAPSRRRLFPLRECRMKKDGENGTSTDHKISISRADRVNSWQRASVYRKLGFSDDGNDEGKENGDSGSESESLGGFIVNNSDDESVCSSDGESGSCSSDPSEEDMDLAKLIAKIRREKDTKEWEYEADMLSQLAKNPELCMKAVCALYRQQTSEEQSIKGSLLLNERGFNKLDAKRGSMMAEFLTDGDPYGPLRKSVEEVKRYDPHGVEYCRKLAIFYSKQLFKIYLNKEDPYFFPS